jgi:AsmA family protein
MSFRRWAAVLLAVAGSLLVAAVLYVGLGGLGRHKARIEALVSDQVARPFAIDGAFEVRLLPSIKVLAERVRLGNAPWGSRPQMVEIGRFSAEVRLWSLISGPLEIPSVELADVSVLLEEGSDGKGNWVVGSASAPAEEPAQLGSETTQIPAVVVNAALRNVRIIYRAQKQPERVAHLESLTIGPGSADLLAVSGKGRLNDYPVAVNGELGTLDALVSGRDIRIAIEAVLGELRLDASGGIGRLNPLRGADLTVKLAHPDIGAMLKKLQLPAVANGAVDATVRLSDAGEATRIDLAAKVGDITAKVEGTLRTLGLPGSDLRFTASLADLARLAAVFDVRGLPAGALELGGHAVSSRTEIKLDGFDARYAGVRAKADGTIGLAKGAGIDMRFEVAAASLARLQDGLPEVPLLVNGNYVARRARLEVKQIKGRIGENAFTGQVALVDTGKPRGKPRIEVELAAPRLDLAPLTAKKTGDGAKAKPAAKPKESPGKFVFDEAPLPFAKLKQADAKVHIAFADVRPGVGTFRDLDATLQIENGRLTLGARAKGGVEGALDALLTLKPAADGAAELDLKVTATRLRAGLGVGGIEPAEEPPTSAEVILLAQGGTARQMASGANGRVLLTQDPGKLPSGLLGLVGGGLLSELAGKLNPFSAQDPYTLLDCTVARADIVDGQMAVQPVLVQSQKVTIVAGGAIDLRTEELAFDFNTRPRKGIGVSAGMFANPFIHVAGTLASPRLGASAKAATAGAAAVATGGASILAQGFFDRWRGSQDLCKESRELAAAKR